MRFCLEKEIALKGVIQPDGIISQLSVVLNTIQISSGCSFKVLPLLKQLKHITDLYPFIEKWETLFQACSVADRMPEERRTRAEAEAAKQNKTKQWTKDFHYSKAHVFFSLIMGRKEAPSHMPPETNPNLGRSHES